MILFCMEGFGLLFYWFFLIFCSVWFDFIHFRRQILHIECSFLKYYFDHWWHISWLPLSAFQLLPIIPTLWSYSLHTVLDEPQILTFPFSVSLAIYSNLQTNPNLTQSSFQISENSNWCQGYYCIHYNCVCVIDKDSVPISIGSIFYNKHHRIKFFNSFFMYGRWGSHWKHFFWPEHAPYVRARA